MALYRDPDRIQALFSIGKCVILVHIQPSETVKSGNLEIWYGMTIKKNPETVSKLLLMQGILHVLVIYMYTMSVHSVRLCVRSF